jgi:hypothetical protein
VPWVTTTTGLRPPGRGLPVGGAACGQDADQAHRVRGVAALELKAGHGQRRGRVRNGDNAVHEHRAVLRGAEGLKDRGEAILGRLHRYGELGVRGPVGCLLVLARPDGHRPEEGRVVAAEGERHRGHPDPAAGPQAGCAHRGGEGSEPEYVADQVLVGVLLEQLLQDGVLVGYGVYEGVNPVVVEHLRSRGELRALRVFAEEPVVEIGRAGDRHEGEPCVFDVRAEAAAGDDRDVVAAPGEPPAELKQR